MAQKKEKRNESQKLVESAPEIVEDPSEFVENCEPNANQKLNPTENLLDSEKCNEAISVATLQQKTPVNVLKSTILRALPFVLVSLAVFSIPFLTAPEFSFVCLKYAQVRTYMLCAVIWNLIGAVLYAQVDKRLSRFMIILIFALPLITSHMWASLLYTIEMSLRAILSAPL